VRDPAVHWNGAKVIFSMVVGAATQQYQVGTYRWQLYEITGLGVGQTPVISKVPNQPSAYNNVAPTYATDESIIFVSDRPRDDTVRHTYPQRDEYESSPVNSGLWKLNPSNGDLAILDHSPSGNFNPSIDSFGRVIFTRWDHLQRDQQNAGVQYGAFNYDTEIGTTQTQSKAEVFPEPRSNADPDRQANVNLFTINQFFPWTMNEDGTGLETLNHVGRQEIGLYSERSFNDDSNVQEFYGQYATGANQNEFTIFLHIKEDPTTPGTYLGTNCQEFATHAAGQLLSINGAPGVNPDNMQVTYLTHPATSGASNSPPAEHTGLYRDPLPLSNGKLLASHTSEAREDTDVGASGAPLSRYSFRLKLLAKSGAYFQPSSLVTSGISKSVSFWSPDQMTVYSGILWEMMAVELVQRTRPSALVAELPSVEANVISGLGVSVAELQEYLRSQNLALIVSRNVTTRDRNDRQQPTNLRVEGGGAESLPRSGKIYNIAQMQFFQGDLIRGYTGGSGGRRVIAQPMHSVAEGINPIFAGAAVNSTQIAEDGSMAAFVPARRALTWHMAGSDGTAVVRERYWVTFQPGEIRVCASCHGINTADHLGNPAPSNPPLALTRLIAHWKNLPFVPTPSPTTYSLRLSSTSRRVPGGAFALEAEGKGSESLKVTATISGTKCGKSVAFKGAGTSRILSGKFPKVSAGKFVFSLRAGSSAATKARRKVTLIRGRLPASQSSASACARLIRSLH